MLCNSKKLSTEIATCVPDDPAERLMVAILVFIVISANYGDDQIVFIRLDPRGGNSGERAWPKREICITKVS